MLTTADILKRVRKIEIKTKGLSNHIFAGEYHSAFKGRGMSFSEVREYSPGDDVKNIDWNVTARFRSPFVKVFEEERELTVMLLADASGSALFGTTGRSKLELITELCAVLAFSANTNNDKVGLLLFGESVDLFIPPKKGRSHVLRIIRELIARSENGQPQGTTNIAAALDYLNNVQKKRSIAFLLSDMVSLPFTKSLQLAARRHDLVGIDVYDPHDAALPEIGLVQVRDAETGQLLWIDSGNKKTRQAYAAAFLQHQQATLQTFRKSGARLLSLRTDQDYVNKLQTFFKGR